MTGLQAAITYLMMTTVITTRVRHHQHSDLCHPCAGSSLSDIRPLGSIRMLQHENQCSTLHEIHIRLLELKHDVFTESQTMERNVFDGNADDLDPIIISGPGHLSLMASIYNRLVYLHVAMKLMETHPKKNDCAVATSSIADRLPFCYLRSLIPPDSLEIVEFFSVCSDNGYLELNMTCTCCAKVEEDTYRVLKTASCILRDVHSDIRRLQRQYGCVRH